MMVCGAIAQAPQLYAGGVAEFSVTDLLRYQEHIGGRAWTHEFGDPVVDQLKEVSPLHMLIADRDIPPVLVITSFQDDRVAWWHGYEFFLRLQDLSPGKNRHAFVSDDDIGHWNWNDQAKAAAHWATVASFLEDI